MKTLFTSSLLTLFFVAATALPADAPALPLHDGDRVLFLGNGYVENDQRHAYTETRLQRHAAKMTFRYMGWSGDTVRGNARTSGFQVPDGMGRLVKEVFALKPTVIFLAYGMNESFDGSQGLLGFLQDYDRLLKTLDPLKARLVILSPTYHEDLGRPFPDPVEHNQVLREFTVALQEFAKKQGALFVDLWHPLEKAKKAHPEMRLTTNGLLLTQTGYAVAGQAIEAQLGYSAKKAPLSDDAERLRTAIVLRNQLFYRRWRPYNDHSRHWGFIGGDFKLYDQEIAAQEQRIESLRRTMVHETDSSPK